MAHHLAAYFSSALSTVDDLDIPALTDDVITISNQRFLPQRALDIVYGYAGSALMNRARIVSPSNRQVTLPFIRPTNLGQNPITQQGIADYRSNPFRVAGLEELAIEATSDIASGTEDCTILLGLSESYTPAPRGDVYTMRATSTTASVADAWTTVVASFPDALPQGDYSIVGLEYVAVTATAARLLLNDQRFRPGCVASVLINSEAPAMFRKGGLGEFGRFRSTAMPEFQVLNSAAVSVHTFFLDIVRVG